MARQLKVYGSIAIARPETPTDKPWHRQIRMVVATTSQKAAAEAMDMSIGDFRHSGGETGNAVEIEAAMSAPGQVFWMDVDGHKDIRPWTGQQAAAERRAADLISRAKYNERVEEMHRERAVERQRQDQSDAAAALWAQRLRDEFNIDCRGADNGKVEVLVPAEKLYGRLVEIAGVLRDVGMEDLLTEGASS